MKRVLNNHQDKKGFLLKATATASMLVALAACERQAPITEGIVFQKEHVEEQVRLMPVVGVGQITPLIFYPIISPEKWTVQIAKCPKGELSTMEKIETECQTNSINVSQEIYNNTQVGQYADLKQHK